MHAVTLKQIAEFVQSLVKQNSLLKINNVYLYDSLQHILCRHSCILCRKIQSLTVVCKYKLHKYANVLCITTLFKIDINFTINDFFPTSQLIRKGGTTGKLSKLD